MNDYLDHLIEESNTNPEFRAKWQEAETRIAFVTFRKGANLTQEEVALRMGIARPRVAELESRPWSVSFGRMLAYANAIGVPIETLAKTLKQAS